MKQTTFAQRLTAALVALCMVLSVCAPALAADDRVIWIQKSGGKVQLLNASTIGTKLPGCSYAYDGTTVTITMAASQGEVMEGVTLAGGPSTDIVLVCTNNTRMDGGLGLTITGMRNVTITGSNAKGSMLVWNTAGRPEPAGAPAFADVTDPDMAKAAQWCTEQGTMAAKGDRFEPEGWTPKFKVIEVWNKAFPAA